MRDGRLRLPGTAVPLLTGLGASPVADLVFRTLNEYGPQSEAELRQALGLPAERVRQALDELAGSGAADPVPSGGRATQRRWRNHPPEVAVDRLRQRRRESVRASHIVRRWLATLPGLDRDCQVEPAQALTAHPLHGSARVRTRIAELVDAVRHEHLSMHPEPAFSRAAVRAAAPLDQRLAAREVSVQTLGVPPAGNDCTRAHTEELTRRGIRYRELPVLPTKLMIFDRQVAVLPLDPLDIAKGALELRTPDAVRSVAVWFLRQWETARPPSPGLATTVDFTPREQSIVALLAAGHTDASAAAQLGISIRTVAYSVRGLMDRYNVQNRFQLGLVLGATSTDQLPGDAPGAAADPPDQEEATQ
jgi:DNA-binding CsgD family transcriptional regulator/sugar-specific transcriptional regulator TrmB